MHKEVNYKQFIQMCLAERRARNPSYSLRAFARDIGLSPSHLSEFFKGRQNISRRKATVVGQALGLKPPAINLFLDAVDFDSARSPAMRRQAKERLHIHDSGSAFRTISHEKFSLMRHWYHLAILETVDVLTLTGIRPTVNPIAEHLGLQTFEVKPAIDILVKLGLLEFKGKVLRRTVKQIEAAAGENVEAIRAFHSQILSRAMNSIDTQKTNERSLNTLILSFSESDLEEANNVINNFCVEFNDRFGSSKNRNKVYCLSAQLFRLSK